jgi:hypothetical protein
MSGKTAALEILFPRVREAGAPVQLGLSRAGDGAIYSGVMAGTRSVTIDTDAPI